MADLNTYLSRFLYTRLPQIGGGTSGSLTVSTTTAQTGADTNATDLWTYSLPANTLSANGSGVRITAWGQFAATANTKTLALVYGATTLRTTAQAANGLNWHIDAIVLRTGASAEAARINLLVGTGFGNPTIATAAENTANASTIKIVGTNGTAAAGDIVFSGVMVELVGSPN